jgi:hypothetical protein
VKATTGTAEIEKPLTNQRLIGISFARAHSAQYRLYRLYDYSDETDSARFYVLTGAVEDHEQLCLAPTNFKVSIRRHDE